MSIRDVVYAIWSLRKRFFLIENLSLTVEYPAVTLDVFQNVEESFYLKKSEHYYSLSNFFAGLLLALICSIALVFSIKRDSVGTLLINEVPLFNVIPLVWGVITIILLVKIRFITKFIQRRFKSWNQGIIVRSFIEFIIVFIVLAPSCYIFFFLEKAKDLSPVIGLNEMEALIIINFTILPLISILLSIRYRELANLFLYLAYLEFKKDNS